MNRFPPNINPELYTISSIIIGLILEDDYNASELNSIGNWLILTGQILLTTSAQQQLINNRYQNNTGSNIKSDRNNYFNKNNEKVNKSDLNLLLYKIDSLEKEINKLKKK